MSFSIVVSGHGNVPADSLKVAGKLDFSSF